MLQHDSTHSHNQLFIPITSFNLSKYIARPQTNPSSPLPHSDEFVTINTPSCSKLFQHPTPSHTPPSFNIPEPSCT